MPPNVDNALRKPSTFNETGPVDTYDYGDLYPEGLDLRPGGKLHNYIRDMVLERARLAERFMTQRHDKWRMIDHTLTAYIPLDAYERALKDEDVRAPVSIMVPESYATLETVLTYNMLAFSRPPLFKYKGVGPEDQIGSILLERIVQQQVKRGKALLALHHQLRDAFSYGIGILHAKWCTKKGKRIVNKPAGYYDLSGAFVQDGTDRILEAYTMYEGTVLDCIDPYCYLPDPDAPIAEPQKAEFLGWKEQTSYIKVLSEESESGSVLFNCRYLAELQGTSCIYPSDPSGRQENSTTNRRDTSGATRPIDRIWMYIDLIPAEHGLGDGDEPEKWLFCVAGDEIVTACWPTELIHNMFPVAVCAPESGGHEQTPISRLEIVYGLQEVINFYYNSHVFNVRKALNNNFVVDPKIINVNDLTRRGAGKIIRTRRVVWGRGVKDGIEQLKVDDVTSGHMQDLLQTREIMKNSSGAVDSLQGVQRTRGERVTAAESTATRGSALSRLQKATMIISLQSMEDVGLFYAYHTQQFMSQDTYVQMAGRMQEVLMMEYGIPMGNGQVVGPDGMPMPEQMLVTPYDLNVGFDVSVLDASFENGDSPEDWALVMDKIAQHPELSMTMDITRIMLHVLRLMTKQDGHEFLRKGIVPGQMPELAPTVMPDQQIAEQEQAGNIVPIARGQQNA